MFYCKVSRGISNTLFNIKIPSYDIYIAAMRTELHIVKFKTHPRGKVREFLKCSEHVNNTEHVLFHCPLAKSCRM